MRRNERIPLADLIHAYLPTIKIQPYQLSTTLIDLQTLIAYTHSAFPKIANDLRKKIAEREKVFRQTEKSAQTILGFLYQQPQANAQLATSIIKMSSPPLIIKKQKPILKTQLKLFFLQSQGVTLQQWNVFYRPQLGVLAVNIPEQNAEVLVGLGQHEQNGLEWKIFGATIEGQLSVQLSQFLQIFLKWRKQSKPEWKQYLLVDIKQILHNLQVILLYLEIANQYPSNQNFNLSDRGLFSIKLTINNVPVKWIFSFFEQNKLSNFKFQIQEQQVIQLTFAYRQMTGHLKICSKHDDVQNLLLNAKGCKIPNFDELIQFSQIIFNLSDQYNSVYTEYPSLKYQKISFFAKVFDNYYLPESMISDHYKDADQQGLWILIQMQKNRLLQVEKNGKLTSKTWDSKILDEIILKGMSIDNLGRHLGLYQIIRQYNHQLQYPIYQIRMQRGTLSSDNSKQEIQNWTICDRKPYLLYEFRAQRFQTNQRHLPSTKIQEKYPEYENCVLLVQISFDFTIAKFSSWKVSKGLQSAEQKNSFLPDWWKSYIQKLQENQPLNWQLLGNAICYFCRCYLVERVKKIFSQEDSRANFIQFK